MTAPLETLDPLTRHTAYPRLAECLRHFRSPILTDLHGEPAAYALIPHVGQTGPHAPAPATPKPHVYPSLDALARRIHRDRGDEALQLRPAQVRFRDRVRDVTEVLAVDETGARTRRIGYAWHAGRPPEALQRALEAACPQGVVG